MPRTGALPQGNKLTCRCTCRATHARVQYKQSNKYCHTSYHSMKFLLFSELSLCDHDRMWTRVRARQHILRQLQLILFRLIIRHLREHAPTRLGYSITVVGYFKVSATIFAASLHNRMDLTILSVLPTALSNPRL